MGNRQGLLVGILGLWVLRLLDHLTPFDVTPTGAFGMGAATQCGCSGVHGRRVPMDARQPNSLWFASFEVIDDCDCFCHIACHKGLSLMFALSWEGGG